MTPQAFAIRDAVCARLAALALFKTVHASTVEQIEPADQMPSATVRLIQEIMTADGDANAGEPSFSHDLAFAIIFKVDAGEKQDLEPEIQAMSGQTVHALLTDPDFVGLFEGVSRIEQTHRFPKDGETYFGEGRIQFDVLFRSVWQPLVPDDYHRTVLKTRELGGDPGSARIETVIDLAQ